MSTGKKEFLKAGDKNQIISDRHQGSCNQTIDRSIQITC